jgi:hypothetical protein
MAGFLVGGLNGTALEVANVGSCPDMTIYQSQPDKMSETFISRPS